MVKAYRMDFSSWGKDLTIQDSKEWSTKPIVWGINQSLSPIGKDLLVSITVSASRNHAQKFRLLYSRPFSFLLELDVLIIKILWIAKYCFINVNDCNFNNILENIISKS